MWNFQCKCLFSTIGAEACTAKAAATTACNIQTLLGLLDLAVLNSMPLVSTLSPHLSINTDVI